MPPKANFDGLLKLASTVGIQLDPETSASLAASLDKAQVCANTGYM